MPDCHPQSGDVYYYPYVWRRQHPGAEAEKDRPCCVALRLKKPFRGRTVFLLAISTSGTPEGGFGIPVPEVELKRLKRPALTECWLTTSECNLTAETSPAFHRSEYLGTFSSEFVRDVVVPQIEAAVRGEMARAGG